jgi:hypothetical protein
MLVQFAVLTPNADASSRAAAHIVTSKAASTSAANASSPASLPEAIQFDGRCWTHAHSVATGRRVVVRCATTLAAAPSDVRLGAAAQLCAAGHLSAGGKLVYYTSEVNSPSRRHQRALLRSFLRWPSPYSRLD